MTILGLQKLLLILGSKAAVEFRDRVLECFNRVLAGDRTLIREIEANAGRDGPVQQIARAALAAQATEERAGGAPATAGQVVAGECLELELAERRLELKRRAEDWEQSLVERQTTLKERQTALPLTIQRQKLELAATWVQCMQQVNPDWRADARLQLQAQDRLSSAFLLEPRLAIAADPAQGAAQGLRLESASLTLKEVADSLRAEVGRHDDRFLLRAGRAAAQLYAERRGRPPGKHKEMHGGRVLDVNSYTEADRALLEEAVRSTIAGGSRPLTQFFAPR